MSHVNAPAKALIHLRRAQSWETGGKPFPVSLEIDLSNRCSHGCEWCHFAHTHTRGPWASRSRDVPVGQEKGGDIADIDMICRLLTEVADNGTLSVIWSGGGEPTTHPLWPAAVEQAARVGLKQGMYTAGSLLSDVQAGVLACYADWVVVSIDEVHADAYAARKGVSADFFDRACRSVRAMSESWTECAVGCSFMLHEGNWQAAEGMLDLSRSLGATYAIFRPTVLTSPANPGVKTSGTGWIEEAHPLLQALATEPDVELDPSRFLAYRNWRGRSYRACYGIRLNATVTPDGRVWVCPNRREMPDSSIGDLTRETFREIWDRHPGQWTDFQQCRVMCRLHQVNEQMDAFMDMKHAEFV